MNIAGLTAVDDPSYRYKMPRVLGKVEGRGNGIKTVLLNVTDVGASLNRDAPEITKFFGCELGSQTTYSADTDRAIVNGAHRDQDLQNHLSRYIENFVLCKNCRLPETHYKIKDGMISQKCLACGAKESVDMTHKLTSFILAQHKKNKEATKDAAKGEKKEKKKDKADKGEKTDKADKPEKEKKEKKHHEDETPEQKAERKREKAAKKAAKEASGVGENVFGISGDAEDEEEESDSKAAGKYNILIACEIVYSMLCVEYAVLYSSMYGDDEEADNTMYVFESRLFCELRTLAEARASPCLCSLTGRWTHFLSR